MSIGVFTAVCEEDRGWLDPYLAEVVRLGLPFVMHFDRCSLQTRALVVRHPSCLGYTKQDDPAREFQEWDKQDAFDLLVKAGLGWALAMDVDESWEADAPAKLRALQDLAADHVTCRWLNLWGDAQHVRVDGKFATSERVKLYSLRSGRWRFDHPITNGAKLVGREAILHRSDLVCLHHGLMTHELRVLHKARWDRIYGAAVGSNPYSAWRHALESAGEAVTVRHGYGP